MKYVRALLVALVAATPAGAHIAPIPPSTCVPDVQLFVAGAPAAVDPPAPSEQFRIVYTPNSSLDRSRIQVCRVDPVNPTACVPGARGFTAGSTQGTLALPATFNMRLVASGELQAVAVPVALTVDASPATVPFDLTTEFVVTQEALLLGEPIRASGSVTLLGAAEGGNLPPPFTNAALLLRLTCTLEPPPDLDQFALASSIKSAKGVVTPKRTKLNVTVDSEGLVPDFSAPAVVRLAQGNGVVVLAMLPAGLSGSGRRFSADLATGSVIVVQKKRSHKVVLKDNAGFVGPIATGDGELQLEVGGLFARVPVAFRANRSGSSMKVKTQ